jgi:DNA-binding transcriptional LysR family regulator
LLKRLVIAGLGLGFLPRSNVQEDTKNGALKIIRVEGVRLNRELALIYRKDKVLTRAAHVFLEIATGRPRLHHAAAPVVGRTRVSKSAG